MAGSLVQVDHFEISSAVSTVTLGGGSSGSSSTNFAINTDDVYLAIYRNVYMSNDGAVPNVRLTVSGCADTNSNYDNARMNIYANTSHYDGNNQNSTYFPTIGRGTTSQESSQGQIYCYNFNPSDEFSFITWSEILATETPEYIDVYGGGCLTTAQTTDGIQWVANSGNIANGEFTLYKVV